MHWNASCTVRRAPGRKSASSVFARSRRGLREAGLFCAHLFDSNPVQLTFRCVDRPVALPRRLTTADGLAIGARDETLKRFAARVSAAPYDDAVQPVAANAAERPSPDCAHVNA